MTTLMISLNALYVAGEFAAVSARKTRVEQLASEGNRMAKMVLPILEDHHRLDSYIAASQVGITLSSVILGIYGQRQIAPLIEPLLVQIPFVSEVAAVGVSATVVLILLTTLQVILGELVPKSVALQYPEKVALLTAIPMRWSADIVLKPLIVVLNGSGVVLMNLLNIQTEGGHKHVHSPEEIKYLIQQSHAGGLLDEQEHLLLDRAFRFGILRVGEVVVPRPRMVTAATTTSVDDILRLAAESDLTRIPVYETDIDHITGFVHMKDLFRLSRAGEVDASTIVRPVAFVPETLHIDDVWLAMDEQSAYVAIVFDEYGGTLGMVTREDLIEELIGEVQDEFDEDQDALITLLPDRSYRVRGDTSLTLLKDRFGLAFSTEDAYTIAGLFINELGRIPKAEDTVTIGGAQLTALSVVDKVIASIQLRLPLDPDEESREE